MSQPNSTTLVTLSLHQNPVEKVRCIFVDANFIKLMLAHKNKVTVYNCATCLGSH